jgi:hypothetical protein
MELAREAWTDERLDDLVGHMDERFTRVDKDIALLRNETRSGFGRVDAGFERADGRLDKGMHELRLEMHTRFDAIDRRFDALDRRFDALHRTMLFFYCGLVLALVGFIAAPA